LEGRNGRCIGVHALKVVLVDVLGDEAPLGIRTRWVLDRGVHVDRKTVANTANLDVLVKRVVVAILGQQTDVAFTVGHLVLAGGVIGHVSIRDVLDVTNHAVEDLGHLNVSFVVHGDDLSAWAVLAHVVGDLVNVLWQLVDRQAGACVDRLTLHRATGGQHVSRPLPLVVGGASIEAQVVDLVLTGLGQCANSHVHAGACGGQNAFTAVLFEGYEEKWKTANTNNWPYLEVNPDVTDGSGSVLPLPSRAQPPMASSGLLQAKSGAAEDIKSTTGQYNASLGMGSNERSGKAILARQKEGDVGTYHYGDNLSRAVRHVARQLVDLIPKIYDTERIARIIGEDGETKMAKINPEQAEPVKEIRDMANPDIVVEKIYNPGVGKYDVVASTGPGYATKRQEALEAMAQLLQGNPDLWKVAGDLFVKNMDWPGAQEMSERFKKTIDPQILASNDKSPELQAAEQQIQAMGAEMEAMHNMIQNVGKSIEMQDMQRKDYEAQVKAFEAETKRLSVVQASMSPDQIQDIVLGTVHGMITSGDLMAEMPGQDIDVGPEMMPEQMEQMPQGMPPEGIPQ